MSKLQDYINTLTDEEKEQYKDIIQDCLELDEEIRKNSERSKEKIKQFTENLERLEQSLVDVYNHFYSAVESLRQDIDSTRYLNDVGENEWKKC